MGLFPKIRELEKFERVKLSGDSGSSGDSKINTKFTGIG